VGSTRRIAIATRFGAKFTNWATCPTTKVYLPIISRDVKRFAIYTLVLRQYRSGDRFDTIFLFSYSFFSSSLLGNLQPLPFS